MRTNTRAQERRARALSRLPPGPLRQVDLAEFSVVPRRLIRAWRNNRFSVQLYARLTAVDLFAGAGGFSLGILAAGFDVVAAVDNDPVCLVTYASNLGADRVDIRFVEPEDEERLERYLDKHLVHESGGVLRVSGVSGQHRVASYGPPGWTGVPVYWFGDASKLTGERILASIGLKRGELDLVVGGPPCQGFSCAGKQDVHDPRNQLIFEFARLIVEMQPRTMAMEEVPAVLSMETPQGGSVIDEVCRILERGDFGEYAAMRAIMTGERRVLRRGAGKKRKALAKKRPEKERPEKQLEFFEAER